MSFRTDSKVKQVNKSPERIFNFISNFHNFQYLLPPDKIENWSCTESSCSFTLKGLTQLSLHVSDKKPFSQVKYSSEAGAKFPFDLFVDIQTGADETTAVCKVSMDLHMNPAVKVLAGKALQNFVDMLADKLEETEF